jgi:hypothetical protein
MHHHPEGGEWEQRQRGRESGTNLRTQRESARTESGGEEREQREGEELTLLTA